MVEAGKGLEAGVPQALSQALPAAATKLTSAFAQLPPGCPTVPQLCPGAGAILTPHPGAGQAKQGEKHGDIRGLALSSLTWEPRGAARRSHTPTRAGRSV